MTVNPVINITISQGADFSEIFQSTESDGSASNLFGYTGSASMKKHFSSSTSYNFSVSITSSTGEVSIAMTSGATSQLSPGRYYYDVRLRSPSNNISRLVEGMALVRPGITTS